MYIFFYKLYAQKSHKIIKDMILLLYMVICGYMNNLHRNEWVALNGLYFRPVPLSLGFVPVKLNMPFTLTVNQSFFSYFSNSSGIFSLVDWSMLSSLRPCSPPLCLFRLTCVYSSIVICELCGAATMFCHRAGRLTASYSSVWKGVICLVNCLSVWLQQPQHIQDQHLKKKGFEKTFPHLSTLPSLHHWSIMSVVICECAEFPYWEYTHTHTHTLAQSW